jgi:hypothetical protein
MTILVQDVQAAQKRVTETSRAYVEARAELRALEAHYTRIMQAAHVVAQKREDAPPAE